MNRKAAKKAEIDETISQIGKEVVRKMEEVKMNVIIPYKRKMENIRKINPKSMEIAMKLREALESGKIKALDKWGV